LKKIEAVKEFKKAIGESEEIGQIG